MNTLINHPKPDEGDEEMLDSAQKSPIQDSKGERETTDSPAPASKLEQAQQQQQQ